MKYGSHKKWLSSLSSTALYNESPVPAETRGIVTRRRTHIWSPKDSLGVEEPRSTLATTSHAGLLAFYSTLTILALLLMVVGVPVRLQSLLIKGRNKRISERTFGGASKHSQGAVWGH